MLIQITDRLVALAEVSGPLQQKAKEVLEFLDITHRLGKHFIFIGQFHLFDRIRQLGIRADSLVDLESSYTFDKQIADTFRWRVEINDSPQSYRDDSAGVITISLNDIPHFQLYSDTFVIGEHLNDVIFFEQVLSYYMMKNSYSISTSFHKILGGGSTTSEVFKHEQSLKQSFVLCISDSDYAFPGAALGDTAKAIKKVWQANSVDAFCSYYYHFKHVGEVENLIPLSLYHQYCNRCSEDMLDKCNKIERVVKDNPNSFHYIDLKEGISAHTIDKHSRSRYFFDWLKPICPDIESSYLADKEEIENHVPPYGSEDKKKKMKSVKYLSGMGHSILDNVLKNFTKEDVLKAMSADASDQQKEEYEQIGSLLYNWCCAREKTRL